MLSKAIRIIGAVLAILVLIVLCLILIFDPPPFRLWDEDKFVLSVKPPPTLNRNLAGSIEDGLACKVKLDAYMSGRFGRPVINFFDWLKHLKQGVPEKDYHLYGTKPDDSWAIKVDRAANKFCWLTANQQKAGITDAYRGPDIIREDGTRNDALQADKYGAVIAVSFDKKSYTATIANLDWSVPPASASIEYLECH
jgi:hypothetical protein